jgi:hypothetical protein
VAAITASSMVGSAAGGASIFSWRHSANSRSSRFEMSCIIPPRPKRASRPVIVKSVSTSTRVRSSSSRIVLTIVAFAEP